jgi:hypothetical protein
MKPILLIILLLPIYVHGDAMYVLDDGSTVRKSLFAKVPWIYEFHESNLVVIDMHLDIQIFNYCDIASYTPLGVSKLLEAHHVTPLDIARGVKWISWHSQFESVVAICMKLYTMSYEMNYLLITYNGATFLSQKAGMCMN